MCSCMESDLDFLTSGVHLFILKKSKLKKQAQKNQGYRKKQAGKISPSRKELQVLDVGWQAVILREVNSVGSDISNKLNKREKSKMEAGYYIRTRMKYLALVELQNMLLISVNVPFLSYNLGLTYIISDMHLLWNYMLIKERPLGFTVTVNFFSA